MFNLKQLQVLHELSRHGTLAKTAAALHFTPSAVSQQLSALQHEAGVQLLVRVGRGVRLTPAADRLVEHTRAVLDRLALAESELAADHGGPGGLIRIASFHTVLLEIAPVALSILGREHPDLRVQLVNLDVDAAHEGLLSHDFDLVLGEEYPAAVLPAQPGVHREDFHDDPLRLVTPQHLPQTGTATPRTVRSLADLSENAWVMEPPGTRISNWAWAQCREAGFEPHVLAQTPDPLLNLQLVRHGLAVAFVPAILRQSHLAGVTPYALPGDPRRTLFTEVRAGRQTHPSLRAVRQALRQAANSLPPTPAVTTLGADTIPA